MEKFWYHACIIHVFKNKSHTKKFCFILFQYLKKTLKFIIELILLTQSSLCQRKKETYTRKVMLLKSYWEQLHLIMDVRIL